MLTIAETQAFARDAEKLLAPTEREALLIYLAANPLSGALIPGTGGIRKLRWAGNAKGKSGGFRVIYYFYDESFPLYALAIYGKGSRSDLTARERQALAAIAAEAKAEARKKRIKP